MIVDKIKMPSVSKFPSGLVKREAPAVLEFVENQAYYAKTMRVHALRQSDEYAVRHYRDMDAKWEKTQELLAYLLEFYNGNV